jgi:hypothetical protein
MIAVGAEKGKERGKKGDELLFLLFLLFLLLFPSFLSSFFFFLTCERPRLGKDER